MPSINQVEKADAHLLESRKKAAISEKDATIKQSQEMMFSTFKDSLKLFMSSIKYQDPMDPVDTSEMAKQMFQLSQAQGQYAMLEKIEEQNELIRASQVLSASGLIGKRIEVQSNKFNLTGDDVEIGTTYPAGLSKAKIEILDEKNSVVFQREVKPKEGQKVLEEGKQAYLWKGEVNTPYGKNLNKGESLTTGDFKVRITAYDAKGEILKDPATDRFVELPTTIKAPLIASDFSDMKPKVKIGNQVLPLSSVISIQEQPQKPKEEPIDRALLVRRALNTLSEEDQVRFKTQITELAKSAKVVNEKDRALEQEINELDPTQYNKLVEEIEAKLNLFNEKGDK